MVAVVTSGPEGQWFKFPDRQAVKVAETQQLLMLKGKLFSYINGGLWFILWLYLAEE